MQKVFVMCGLPGSGKSTKAKEIIIKNENTYIINKDAIRLMLVSGNYNNFIFNNQTSTIINDIVYNTAKILTKNNIDIVFDECHLIPEKRLYIKWDIFDNSKIIGYSFPINPNNITLYKKRRQLDTKNSKKNWNDIIDTMLKKYIPPTNNEFHELYYI